MKKLLALLLLPSLVFSQVEKNIVSFTLSCKVTGQVLIKTKDGVSTSYSSYRNGLENGDTFPIEFIYESNDNYYALKINANDIKVNTILQSSDSEGTMNGIEFNFGNQDKSILWDNGMFLQSISSQMHLYRYYKNDYELMHSESVGVNGVASRTLTANCMNMPDTLEKVQSLIKIKESAKWGIWDD